MKSTAYGVFLITSKVLDARRRGATRLNRMGQYAARRSDRSDAADDVLLVDQGLRTLLQFNLLSDNIQGN
jgi:hypothetical protein